MGKSDSDSDGEEDSYSDEQKKAAIVIQSRVRGRNARKKKKKKGKKGKSKKNLSEEEQAAAKIQARLRGNKDRKGKVKDAQRAKREKDYKEEANFWSHMISDSSSDSEQSDDEEYEKDVDARKQEALDREEKRATDINLVVQKSEKRIAREEKKIQKKKLEKRTSMYFGKDRKGAYLRRWDTRAVRDCPCLFLFIVYWVAMIIVGQMIRERGDWQTLVRPTDSNGKVCGVGENEGYPNVWYAEPLKLIEKDLGRHFCVKDCPGAQAPEWVDAAAADPKNFICPPDIVKVGGEPKSFSDRDFIKKHSPSALSGMSGPCYKPYGPMFELMFQCVPYVDVDCVGGADCNSTNMATTIAKELGTQHLQDVYEYRVIIYCSGVFSLITALAWVQFLDWFAGPLIYATIIASEVSLLLVSLISFLVAGTVSTCVNVPSSAHGINNTVIPAGDHCLPSALTDQLSAVSMSQDMAYSIGVASGIAALVMLCIVLVFRTRLYIAIGVIEEASDGFLEMPQITTVPVVTLALAFAALSYNVVTTLDILALEPASNVRASSLTEEQRNLLYFFLFGGLWTQYLIVGVQYTTVAGAIADWYFTFKDKSGEKEVRMWPVFRSFGRVMLFNLGSVAFGSFVISVVTIIKYIAIYMVSQVMQQSPENKLIQWLGRCLIAAIHCVDKFVRFLGSLAYIEVAIYNVSFCKGIVTASKRLLTNIVRFSFVTVFSKVVVFLGKVLVVGGNTAVCAWIIMYTASANEKNKVKLSLPIAPVVICGIISALVAWPTLDIYNIAIDTIMMCFLEDEAENVGKKPSFATGPLARFMKGTKKIADIEEMYKTEVVRVKTNRIKAMRKRENKLLKKNTKELHEEHQNLVKAMRKRKKRSAKQRRSDRREEKGSKQEKEVLNPMSQDDKDAERRLKELEEDIKFASPRNESVKFDLDGDGDANTEMSKV